KKGHAAANNPAKENFDIRDKESPEAMLKFERRMEKLSSMRKEKSANLKLAMWSAKKRKAESVEGLEVTFRDLTNSPEIIEVSGRERKFLTPPPPLPRETAVSGFTNANPAHFSIIPMH